MKAVVHICAKQYPETFVNILPTIASELNSCVTSEDFKDYYAHVSSFLSCIIICRWFYLCLVCSCCFAMPGWVGGITKGTLHTTFSRVSWSWLYLILFVLTNSSFCRIMPALLGLLKKKETLQIDKVVFASLTALHRIMENLANFISPHLNDVVIRVREMWLKKLNPNINTCLCSDHSSKTDRTISWIYRWG